MSNDLTLQKGTMCSLQIAELTGKKHAHVMRDIRSLLEQGVAESNFGLGSYSDTNGQERLNELSNVKKCPLADLVQVTKGGDNPGTWMHEVLSYGV